MRYTNHPEIGGYYELNPFPGCNQVVVSNHSWIPPANRGKGMGDYAHRERLHQIRALGYNYALCTVKADNVAQIAILERNGWKKLDDFFNTETGNQVELWGKHVV